MYPIGRRTSLAAPEIPRAFRRALDRVIPHRLQAGALNVVDRRHVPSDERTLIAGLVSEPEPVLHAASPITSGSACSACHGLFVYDGNPRRCRNTGTCAATNPRPTSVQRQLVRPF